MNRPLRLAFMGTPDFAVPALHAVLDSGNHIVCVYTQPPRPKGRGQQPMPSPIHQIALEKGIEIRTPSTLKIIEEVNAFKALSLDIAIVAAYGLILPQAILDAPKHGCVNIHGSLLPRWRGAAPLQRAIEEGDAQTGITIMQMEAGLDTGPMILKKALPIESKTTATTLHDQLSELGAQMVTETLEILAQNGRLDSTPQPSEGATYAKMLKKEEGRIEWGQNAVMLDRKIRAFTPWPGTWCETESGGRLKILEAVPFLDSFPNAPEGTLLENPEALVVCGGQTCLKLLRVQPENKKPMSAQDAQHGGYLRVGSLLR